MTLEIRPEPPQELSGYAADTWISLYKTLRESQLLGNIEYNTMLFYCRMSAELADFERFMDENKAAVGLSDHYRDTEIWTRWDKLQDRFWKVVRELGISPKNRPYHAAKYKEKGGVAPRKRGGNQHTSMQASSNRGDFEA